MQMTKYFTVSFPGRFINIISTSFKSDNTVACALCLPSVTDSAVQVWKSNVLFVVQFGHFLFIAEI